MRPGRLDPLWVTGRLKRGFIRVARKTDKPNYRASNRYENYSLALQVLQVFPIVFGALVLLGASDLIATGIIVTLLLLLILGVIRLRTVNRIGVPRVSDRFAGPVSYGRGVTVSPDSVRTSGTLPSLTPQIVDLARRAPAEAPGPLGEEIQGVRRDVLARLDSCHNPRERSELVVLAGMVSCLLADNHLSLGDAATATNFLRSAWRFADISDNDPLRVWCMSARSWVSSISGEPGRAVTIARSGHRYAHNETSRQRLLSMEGNALALAGDKTGALEAFGLAEDASARRQEFDEVFDGVGGVFAASRAKQLQNEANGLTQLRLAGRAITTARRAIDLYSSEAPDSRDYAMEAGARITVSIAFAMLNQLDETWDSLQPVLALPSDRRGGYILMKLKELLRFLNEPKYFGSVEARDVRDGVEQFIARGAHA